MKKNQLFQGIQALYCFSLWFPIALFAGGVSDGGGGTSIPEPIAPATIANAIKSSGPMLLTWLYQKHQQFYESDQNFQNSSPFKKLFNEKEKNIFNLFREISIEVRETSPCFDKSGSPKEASIFTSSPKSICLSPFLMSKKLTSVNVTQETSALIIHEFAHLLGSDETEATAIQYQALQDLKDVSPETVAMNLNYLSAGEDNSGLVLETISPITFWSRDPARFLTFKDCVGWMKDLRKLQEALKNMPSQKLQFVNVDTMNLYQPQFVKLAVIQIFVSTQDLQTPIYERQAAQDLLNKSFSNGETQTAGELYRIVVGNPTPNYELVQIRKPNKWSDIRQLLTEMSDYLTTINNKIIEIKKFTFKIKKLKK